MHYQTLCKKGHAQLAENYKKWKPDLFLNFLYAILSVVAILIGPHCRPYLGKDLCRIHERLDISFLKLKSVRSCALILKPNSGRLWERAHLWVRARVCVCVCVCPCRALFDYDHTRDSCLPSQGLS